MSSSIPTEPAEPAEPTGPTGTTGPTGSADPASVALRRVRRWLWAFVVCLVLSGLTAFPLESETRWLADFATGPAAPLSEHVPGLLDKLLAVRDGIADTNRRYPFLAYGTDWLAFAHLVIAVAFWGPIQDPVRNVWVIRWAVIACGGIIPLALICGPLRGIPVYWGFVDMSFGVVGVIPLLVVLRGIREVERHGAVTAVAPAAA